MNSGTTAFMKTFRTFGATVLMLTLVTMSFPVTALTAYADETDPTVDAAVVVQSTDPAPATPPTCEGDQVLNEDSTLCVDPAPTGPICEGDQVLNETRDACVDTDPAPETQNLKVSQDAVQNTVIEQDNDAPYVDNENDGQCVVVSDTLTTKSAVAAVIVANPHNSRWTAAMDSIAKWIWGENPVNFNSGTTEVETFTRTFSIDEASSGGTLEIAADNGYSVKLDTVPLCSDSTDGPEGSHNYQQTDTCVVGALAEGSHTLEFTVTNYDQAGETQASNPAGLRYKLDVDGADCGEPKTPENSCLAPSAEGSSPEITVNNAPGSEDDLADLIDGSLDVQDDQVNYQTWDATGNDVDFLVTYHGKKANSGDKHVFGWFNGSTFTPVFRDATTGNVTYDALPLLSVEGDDTTFSVTGVGDISFGILDTSSGKYYSTDKTNSLNGDSSDHAVVYNQSDDAYTIALEDLPNAGDHDYNDVVVSLTTECSPTDDTATIIATKIVCDDESYLPNLMGSSHVTDEDTAAEFLADVNEGHEVPVCRAVPNWQFEWGNQNAGDPGKAFVGHAAGYTTSGLTAANGTISMSVPLDGVSEIRVRELLQDGYIPFSYGPDHQSNDNTVSAELSCSNDGLNYDNWDYVRSPEEGETYYCVAWNVEKEKAPICNPQTELLSNGGFEAPAIAAADWDVVPSGALGLEWLVAWINPSGAPATANAELQKNVAGWLPKSGAQYAELDSDWNGHAAGPDGEAGAVTMSQNIATVPGQEYTFSFWFSPRPDQGAGENKAEALVDGNVIGVTPIAGVAGNGSNTSWTKYSFNFTADDTTTTVALRDAAGNPNDAVGTFVDDASVTCVADETPTCPEGQHYNNDHVCVPNDNGGDDDGPFNVFITKYLWNFETDTAEQAQTDSGLPEFTMNAKYTIADFYTNEDPGDSYYLNEENSYSTQTVNLAEGDHYTTSEVTDGDVVIPADGQCVEGKYRLVGYKVGETLEEAQSASITTTAPDFTISGDEYVLVVNEDCDDVFQNPDDTVPTDGGNNPSRNGRSGGGGGGNGFGEVLGASTCGPLLSDYLKLGWNNNPEQVKLLQDFLNKQVGSTLPLSGFFGPETFEAVKLFQKNYWEEVLKPWFGLPGSGIQDSNTPTGFVYQTTRWEINNIFCPGSESFPTQLQ